jgi:hypothetical protein
VKGGDLTVEGEAKTVKGGNMAVEKEGDNTVKCGIKAVK